MTEVYEWKPTENDTMTVEYCFSSVDDCLKVVSMSLNGNYHRPTWMSPKGRTNLMTALENDYHSKTGYTMSSIQMRDAVLNMN
tara:strand:- start:313 stop:561 length:249 start_codon:yes stop_codon:yes gene_type:complete